MISKIKALGLVLAAAFAVSAVAAPAAMAQTNPAHFYSHSANGKTHLHGEQHGGAGENVFTITLEEEKTLTVECPNAGTTFTGTPSKTNEKDEFETFQENTFTFAEVHPVYANEEKLCPVKIGGTNFGKAKIDTEGCTFVLSAHTDAEGHAPVHVWCEPENEITITGPLGCTIHIDPQTPEKGVHYTDHGGTTASEEQAITVDVTVTGVHGTATNCPGVPETFENAHYESKITVTGYEEKPGETTARQTSITWTETIE